MKRSRDEWLAERRTGIGGSDAAAVMGLSPFATPLTVWLDKTGRAGPKEETEAMRIGTELEDYVARSYARETGRRVQRFTRTLHDGCLLGNFDRLVVPEGAKVASHGGEVRTDTLLECKTASREWADGVPLHYQMQVQHYMGLAPTLEQADVAVLFLGRKRFEMFRVPRDAAVIARMREYITEWWERHVVRGEMPRPTCEADCRLAWARSNPGKTVTATEKQESLVEEYAEAVAAADAAAAAADALRSEIAVAMEDAETLVAADGTTLVTWKSAKDSAKVDWEAVARDCGATEGQIAAHTAVRPGARRFMLKRRPAAQAGAGS